VRSEAQEVQNAAGDSRAGSIIVRQERRIVNVQTAKMIPLQGDDLVGRAHICDKGESAWGRTADVPRQRGLARDRYALWLHHLVNDMDQAVCCNQARLKQARAADADCVEVVAQTNVLSGQTRRLKHRR
jgi:hypothetical protein